MTREEAIEEIKNYNYNYPSGLSKECRNYIIKALEQEPRKGHWIERIERDDWNDYEEQYLECSQCHYTDAEQAFNFCPNCGADMREVLKDEIN